ncbi:hypothetical protein GIY23_20640 [Allosaccharopolyspora coralli]|uniref:Uncharacterized protein n=1 Tax=Allosaccharopolyspora coralli TaxID=2665642 RepID=A0A5Q3QET7_9PSEU|nr:hypothetical protein GIY23_20640 [Allosaccharopolyspora coralli]
MATVDDDPRFTLGLVLDVAEVLERHGYPAFRGPCAVGTADLVDLQQTLFAFLYTGGGGQA